MSLAVSDQKAVVPEGTTRGIETAQVELLELDSGTFSVDDSVLREAAKYDQEETLLENHGSFSVGSQIDVTPTDLINSLLRDNQGVFIGDLHGQLRGCPFFS